MLVRCGTRMQVGGRGKPLPYEGRGLHRRGRRPAHGRARTDRRSVIPRTAQPDAAIRFSCVPCRNLAQVVGRFVNRPYGGTWVCTVGADAQPMAGPEQTEGLSLRGGRSPTRQSVSLAFLVGHTPTSADDQWSSLRGNLGLHRRGRRPRRPAGRTSARVVGRFGYRPYGGRGNPLPHLSQATAELGTSHAARASGSSPAGGRNKRREGPAPSPWPGPFVGHRRGSTGG